MNGNQVDGEKNEKSKSEACNLKDKNQLAKTSGATTLFKQQHGSGLADETLNRACSRILTKCFSLPSSEKYMNRSYNPAQLQTPEAAREEPLANPTQIRGIETHTSPLEAAAIFVSKMWTWGKEGS